MAIKNSSVLDINKYVKRNFSEIKDDIEILKNPDNITSDLLTNLFSNKAAEQNENGEITVEEPKYRITDYFDLPPKVLENQPEAIKDTTFGSFIFNSLVINNAFHGKIAYVNEQLNKDNFETLHSAISKNIMEGNITVDEYGEFINATLWLGYQTELFMPGVSLNIVVPKKSVKDLKVKLLKENPEFTDPNMVITSDQVAKYVDKVEDPLKKAAKEEIEKDPSSRLYDLGKPSFGNNYKNTTIDNGPMLDTKTGQYRINNNSFNDGADANNFDLLANKAMYASYSRGVNTAKGGTFAKYTNSMMQSVVLDPKGSDCRTKGTIDYTVTKKNKLSIVYNYAYIGDKLIRLTDDILKGLIGKTIKMRTPLHCKSKTGICNICAGDTFYIMGIKNAGLTSNIPMNSSLQRSMKRFHDLSIKTTDVEKDMENYMIIE